MPRKPEPPRAMPIVDPHLERIRNVDQATFHHARASHLDITCCAFIQTSGDGVDWTNQAVVTARLRMNITMAKAFAEGLMKQIAWIENAKG